MVNRVAELAPPFCADGHSCEALGVDPRFHLRPVGLVVLRCILPVAMVIHDPRWPLKLLAQLGHSGHIQQEGGQPFWVPSGHDCNVDHEALQPRGQIRDQPLCLEVVGGMEKYNLPF